MPVHVVDGETVQGNGTFYRVTHVRKDADFYTKPCPEGLVCHWCVHEIHPNVPVGLPIRYNERKETFRLERQFCSWNCCLAFSHDMNDYHMYDRGVWIRILAKRMCGYALAKSIHMAPKREVLGIFGGPIKDIAEFRKNNHKSIIIETPPICTVIPEEQTILSRLQHPQRVPPPRPRGGDPMPPPPSKTPPASVAPPQKKNNKANYTLNAKLTTKKSGAKRKYKRGAGGQGSVLNHLGITIK